MPFRTPAPFEPTGCPSTEERWGRRITWLFPVVFLGLPILTLWTLGPRVSLALLLGPPLACALGLAIWGASLRHRDSRRLSAMKYKCCAACRYDLQTLPDVGTCPECGTAYRLEDLRETWIRTHTPKQ